jgi:prepilin signal peptidase PulO-like enzyme (type II secretory pathway)
MFSLLLYLPLFILGLAVGSFLNCVIYRIDKKESSLKGRSFCPRCRHKLSWLDLIPVFSFFALKGKCRYCHKKISWQYPLVEIATAGLLILVVNQQLAVSNQFFLISRSIFFFVFSCFLIIIFVYDLKYYLIPDKVVYPAIGLAFIYQLLEASKLNLGSFNLNSLLSPLLSAFLASFFFLLIFLISKGEWLGFGDVKLAVFLGLILSWPNILVALFLAFFIGAIIGTGLIVLKRKTIKSAVPFAPFLVIGTFLALFWGKLIFDWYISLILY